MLTNVRQQSGTLAIDIDYEGDDFLMECGSSQTLHEPDDLLVIPACENLNVQTTEYTEQQRLLSGLNSIMRVKLAQAGEGGG